MRSSEKYLDKLVECVFQSRLDNASMKSIINLAKIAVSEARQEALQELNDQHFMNELDKMVRRSPIIRRPDPQEN